MIYKLYLQKSKIELWSKLRYGHFCVFGNKIYILTDIELIITDIDI